MFLKNNRSVFFALIILFLFAFPQLGVAEDFPAREFVGKLYVSAGIGGFASSEQSMETVYGTLPSFSIGLEREFSRNMNLELSLSRSAKDGTPTLFNDGFDRVEGSADITVTRFELVGKYLFNGKSTRFYMGLGLTSITFSENVSLTAYYQGDVFTESASGSFSGTGAVFVLGVNIPINTTKTSYLYIELAGSSAKSSDPDFSNFDLGGSTIEVGGKLKIG